MSDANNWIGMYEDYPRGFCTCNNSTKQTDIGQIAPPPPGNHFICQL